MNENKPEIIKTNDIPPPEEDKDVTIAECVDTNGREAGGIGGEEPLIEAEPVPATVSEASPVAEAIKKEDDATDKTVNNFSINIHTSSFEDVSEKLAQLSDELPENISYQDLPPEIIKMMSILRSPLNTPDSKRDQIALDEDNADYTQADSKVSHGGRFGTDLRGKTAELAFTARLSGIRKVYLYNSGFHVVIRPWTMGELDIFFRSIDTEDEELGRVIGYHRHTVHDAFVKKKFMELFPSCVVSSNLKGWANNKALATNISFHDYDIIMWAVCTLMHKDSIPLTISCSKDECETVIEGGYDISKMCLLNNKVLSAEAISFIHEEKEGVTPDELKVYRSDIISSHSTITFKDVRYTVVVPTIAEYLDRADKTISDIIATVQGENNIQNRQLKNRLIVDFNNNYIPWIKELAIMDGDKVSISTKDKDRYPNILQQLGHDDRAEQFHEDMFEFMRDTRAAVIGYTPPPCSTCGAVQNSKNGYVAWDAERLFFDLTYQTLAGIGLSIV